MAGAIVQTIIQQIKDRVDPETNLRQLPIGQVPRDNAEALIAHFLQAAFDVKNTEATRTIINIFDELRSHVDPLPALTYLFVNPSMNRDLLLFCVQAFPEKEPLQYYVDVVNMPDDIQALLAVANLGTILPNLSNEDWNLLYQLTDDTEDEEYPNQMLRAFFQTKSAETGENIPRPSWVIDAPTLPLPDIPHGLPSVREAVDLILADMKNRMMAETEDGESVDIQHGAEIREALISQYAVSTVTEKIQMLATVKSFPSLDSTALFREYGPINTIYSVSSSHDPTHVCAKYGGCAMLLCTEFEEIDANGDDFDLMTVEEHLEDIDWYRGSCDICLKKIPYRHYAVRLPLLHGGWKGCYCSFDCMKDFIDNEQIAIMVGRVQEQLSVIGIRDRE
jgi:hypothetical protein